MSRRPVHLDEILFGVASHRVLTLSFEFHVPEGLRSNIRGARLEAAIAAFSSAVHALAPAQFPWADRIVMRSDWSYRWSENSKVISLAATPDNTVDDEDGVIPLDPADTLGPRS